MDKQTAKQTLEQLQKSIADAQRQAKELQAIIDKPDVAQFYQGRVVTLDISGDAYTLNTSLEATSCILRKPVTLSSNGERILHGLMFKTEEAAYQYLDFLKVRQKARVAMANAWGNDKPTWAPNTPLKYCITFNGDDGRCKIDTFNYTYQPIHFPTKETAAHFLASLSLKEAELLIKGM